MDDSSLEQLVDVPPSAKLVFKTLEYADKPLAQQQLIAHSRLGARTTRYALTHLTSVGLVEEAITLTDTRQSIYHLSSIDGDIPEKPPPPAERDR